MPGYSYIEAEGAEERRLSSQRPLEVVKGELLMKSILSGFKTSKGFTLVELLVVIAIISVLMGLVFPALMKSGEKAKIAACASNLKQIYTSSMLYEQDNRSFPFLDEGAAAFEHLQLLVDAGVVDTPKLFICPSSMVDQEADADEEGMFMLTEGNCSYAWTSKRRSMSSKAVRRLAADKVFGDDGQHPNGINVLFVGGNVEWVEGTEDDSWDDLTKSQLSK